MAEDGDQIGYAVWYPQMGGYCGKAVAVVDKKQQTGEGGCVECYIWHDGEFPFLGDDRPPIHIHHCDPGQFIRFGKKLAKFNVKAQA